MEEVQTGASEQPILKAKINEKNVFVVAIECGKDNISIHRIKFEEFDEDELNESAGGLLNREPTMARRGTIQVSSHLITLDPSAVLKNEISGALNFQNRELEDIALATHNLFIALQGQVVVVDIEKWEIARTDSFHFDIDVDQKVTAM